MDKPNRERVVVAFPLIAPQSQREIDVERVNHYPLYRLGKAIRELERLTKIDGEIDSWIFRTAVEAAQFQMIRLLRGPVPLGVSRRSAEELRNTIDEIYSDHFMEDDGKGGKKHKYHLRNETVQFEDWPFGIGSAIEKFETLFSTEMMEAATYIVPARGIFNTAALIDFADQAFPAEIAGHVPEKSKAEWRAAGRCLAFGLMSATGFHVARAVEGIIEAYYQTFSGKPGATLLTWGDYCTELGKLAKAASSPCPDGKTVEEIDQMRRDWRNPLMHPRVVLSESDARILFNNGESLIIAMAREIQEVVVSGGVQPVLGLVSDATAP